MAKYEKSIKISTKPGSKKVQDSYVEGGKASVSPKPKSLTPKAKLMKK